MRYIPLPADLPQRLEYEQTSRKHDVKRERLFCTQCGAPMSDDKCEYCGSVYGRDRGRESAVIDWLHVCAVMPSLTPSECADRVRSEMRDALYRT